MEVWLLSLTEEEMERVHTENKMYITVSETAL